MQWRLISLIGFLRKSPAVHPVLVEKVVCVIIFLCQYITVMPVIVVVPTILAAALQLRDTSRFNTKFCYQPSLVIKRECDYEMSHVTGRSLRTVGFNALWCIFIVALFFILFPGLQAEGDCTPCLGGFYCPTLGIVTPIDLCLPGYFCKQYANISAPDQGMCEEPSCRWSLLFFIIKCSLYVIYVLPDLLVLSLVALLSALW